MQIDNRKFWKTVEPVFTDKVQLSQSITLVENEEMITDDLKIAEIFNDYFANITQDLETTDSGTNISPTIIIEDPVDQNIKTIQALRKLKSVLHAPGRFNLGKLLLKKFFVNLEN